MSDDQHVPYEIGTRDREGWRTFQTPGDVCLGCSEPTRGWWVAVSECPRALARYDAERERFNRFEEELLDELWPYLNP